jgi:hypothetical protein
MEFHKLVEEILQETNVIGGVSSVMGSNVGATASAFSGDTYAVGPNGESDVRVPKSLYGGVLTRRGMNKKKGKKKK